mmetsp:Transcript_28150/g.79509  ORF Transcript_28150/g.79509 Transcript_28150/m.79509 type:complete len:350 (-) Transcript_28150:223-1272(-)
MQDDGGDHRGRAVHGRHRHRHTHLPRPVRAPAGLQRGPLAEPHWSSPAGEECQQGVPPVPRWIGQNAEGSKALEEPRALWEVGLPHGRGGDDGAGVGAEDSPEELHGAAAQHPSAAPRCQVVHGAQHNDSHVLSRDGQLGRPDGLRQPAQAQGRRAPHHRLPDGDGDAAAVQPGGDVWLWTVSKGAEGLCLPLLPGPRRQDVADFLRQGAQLPGGVYVLQVPPIQRPHHNLQRRHPGRLRNLRHQDGRGDGHGRGAGAGGGAPDGGPSGARVAASRGAADEQADQKDTAGLAGRWPEIVDCPPDKSSRRTRGPKAPDQPLDRLLPEGQGGRGLGGRGRGGGILGSTWVC